MRSCSLGIRHPNPEDEPTVSGTDTRRLSSVQFLAGSRNWTSEKKRKCYIQPSDSRKTRQAYTRCVATSEPHDFPKARSSSTCKAAVFSGVWWLSTAPPRGSGASS